MTCRGAYGVHSVGLLTAADYFVCGLHRSDEAPRPDARLCEMPSINGRPCREGARPLQMGDGLTKPSSVMSSRLYSLRATLGT